MTLSGVVGRIEWSYYVAAALEGYTVTGTPGTGWALSARVIQHDAFKLAQRPLRFVAPTARGALAWPIESITIVDGRITARLGKGPDADSVRAT